MATTKKLRKQLKASGEKAAVLTLRVQREDLERLAALGGGRAEHVRAALRRYLDDTEEKQALSELESRLAASILQLSQRVTALKTDLDLLTAMVAQSTEFLMYALPEVMDREAAAGIGGRRYSAFKTQLQRILEGRDVHQ